jgi:type IV secretion system protein VirB10
MIRRTDPAGPKTAPAGDDARPIVPLPSGGPPAGAVVAGFVVLALGLFVFLDGRREHAAHAQTAPQLIDDQTQPAVSPPPLEVPPAAAPAPAPPPAPVIEYVERPAPPPIVRYIERPAPPEPPPQGGGLGRLAEPALVIDLADTPTAGPSQAADDATAHATVLRHRSTLVPQGTIIPAVLETPIDSSRPGPVRAITSEDIRGFDGTRVLVPRGSRLMGEYRSDTQAGQRRVLVTWSRLVRPDGVSVRLAAPASDVRGGAGVPGAVDNHLIARVSSVVLQSALTVGVNLASRPGNGSVVIGAPAQTVGNAGQTLVPTSDSKPTITVKDGAEIAVFVTQDIDFSGALPRP